MYNLQETLTETMGLVKNDKERRFEMKLNGKSAYIEFFQIDNSKIYLTHTKVPEDYRGQGYGKQLVKKALDLISELNMSIVPHCSFISNYIKKNPKYRKLLDRSVSMV